MNLFLCGRTQFSLRRSLNRMYAVWICLRKCLGSFLLLTAFALGDEPPEKTFSDDEIAFFENRIRPLLAEHCYECHSGRSETVQAKLRLDRRALAIRGGESGAAIVPGKPEESLLLAAVRWKGLEMPPERKLSDEQVADLARWIESGAPWPETENSDPSDLESGNVASGYDWAKWRKEHWAFQPISNPQPPAVRDSSWAKTPVDQFILQGLESNGLQPAKPADPRILIRRMYFDLIGLPPAHETVLAFEQAYSVNPASAVSVSEPAPRLVSTIPKILEALTASSPKVS